MYNMNLWNVKDLEPPPITTYKSSAFLEVNRFRGHFKEAVQFFGNQSFLEKEAALLSRCIYRMKTKFRSDKGLKSMEKVNRALLQFKFVNFYKILDDFYSLLPERANSDSHIPSRNMLDYILVRLQGVTCLMSRISETAKIAADNMGSRICIGHFWKVALIMLALLSRIWIICADMLKQCCKLYKNVLPMRSILKNIGNNWLPGDYIFPDNLENRLDLEWMNKKDIHVFPILTSLKSHIPTYDITNHSDVEELGEYIEIKDDEDEIITIADNHKQDVANDEFQKPSAFDFLVQSEDLGEIIHGNTVNKKDSVLISSSDDDVHNIQSDINDIEDKSCKQENVISVAVGGKKKSKRGKIKPNKRSCHDDNIKINSNENKLDLQTIQLKDACVIKKSKQEQFKMIEGNKKYKNIESVKDCTHKKQTHRSSNIETIATTKDLKRFIVNETKLRDQNSSYIFMNIDKLQWTMLEKHVRKLIKRADKNLITNSECVRKAKYALEANLN